MGLASFLHPRRRGLLFRAVTVLTFVGFVCLWFKSDSTSGDPDLAGRNVREVTDVRKAAEKANDIDNPVIKAPFVDDDGGVPQSTGGNLEHSRDKIVSHISNNVNNFNLRPQFVNQPGRGGGSLQSRTQATLDMFNADDARVVPGLGEMGKAVHLTGDEATEADKIMKVEAFNKVLSDKISVNRTVPDSRDPLCASKVYSATLPTASVIIIFTNEAWSPLIRTIHSVLNRSPPQHLKEVLLVDDFSDREELGEKLELYLQHRLPHGVVRLLRLPSRHGLIRARVEGAKQARGDVLIFLDSHCEANIMWMEPLLQRIKESRTAVLVPIIDVIDDKTLEYYAGNGRYFQVGGFSWSGHFTWIEINAEEEKRRGSPIAPTRSPTMAGGLFAMDKDFFWKLGGYDEGMDVWGGENLEMSFRTWMCGGTLETIPCSRVGHIFRSFHPYSFPGNKDTHGLNTARVAEVWMDDYKRLFYLHRPELENSDWGDVSARRELRRRLNCRSFKWYLDTLMPEKFILDEDSFAYGRLRSNSTSPSLCLDTLQAQEKKPYDMGMYNCHNFPATSQYMSLSHAGELRREEVCAEVSQGYTLHRRGSVRMVRCSGNKGGQEWIMTKSGHVMNKVSGLCLDTDNKLAMAAVSVTECRPTATQQWWFDHYNLG